MLSEISMFFTVMNGVTESSFVTNPALLFSADNGFTLIANITKMEALNAKRLDVLNIDEMVDNRQYRFRSLTLYFNYIYVNIF